MQERVSIGHIEPVWNISDFKDFNYVKQPITDGEMVQWKNQGYDYVKSFSGSMYNNSNPMPKWISYLEGTFQLYKQTYNFYKMETLEIMPPHVDHYRTYRKLHGVEYDDVYRVVLMLEDWKPGHYFELDGVGYTNWKAGDWFKWRGDVPHAAANIGIEPRYTLQITGTSVFVGQFNELFCFNVPGVVSSNEDDNPFFKDKIFPALTNYIDSPMMLYMDNRTINQLEEIYHSQEETEKLNQQGLSIHLFEPLCSFDATKPEHNRGFYSEFTDINPEDLRSEELDSILSYAINNKLTNITVCTGDYNVSKKYPHYSSILKLITDDLFLKTLALIDIKNHDTLMLGNFTKKFLCLNWRYTHHRNLVSTYLAKSSAHLSWYFDVPLEMLNHSLFFDLESWKTTNPNVYYRIAEGTQAIKDTGPRFVDAPTTKLVKFDLLGHIKIWPSVKGYRPGTTPALYNASKNELQPFYEDAFVDVINETRFAQPTANISEKVFQTAQYMKPFILVAPPFSLEYVRSLGFKTFSDYWDESYDTETNHEARLLKIFKLIDHIESFSIEELQKLYRSMEPIIKHNKELVHDRLTQR